MGCTGPWAAQEGLHGALDPPEKDCTGHWAAQEGLHGTLEPWEQELPSCSALPLCLLTFLRSCC